MCFRTVKIAGVVAALPAFLLVSCDMFSVRPSEPPDAASQHADWLNVQELLPEAAGYTAYEDLLEASSFWYTQGGGAQRTSAADFISRLHAIDAMLPNIHVEWTPPADFTPSQAPGVVTEENNVVYRVYLAPDSTGSVAHRGLAQLGWTLLNNKWVLVYWQDDPDPSGTDANGFSFFNPEFGR